MADKHARPVHEVFGRSAPPKSMLDDRFGSSGKYSVVELEKPEPAGLHTRKAQPAIAPGVRVKVIGRFGQGEVVEKAEAESWRILFDDGVEAIVLADRISTALDAPSDEPKADRRTLYEKLKEQKDAKQDAWEHQHTFKNQMDHWRLDEEDAEFERERVERLHADSEKQRAEEDEDLRRYKEAMLTKTKHAEPDPAALLSSASPRPPPEQTEGAGSKRKAPFPAAPVGLKVRAVAKTGSAPAAGMQPARSEPRRPEAQTTALATSPACALPGMALYADSDDGSEAEQ
jgi:hypothetical protein